MLSYAGDGATESRCRSDLAVMRCRCRVMLATVLSSHADDGAVGAT
jgi:hypothetical protein